MPRRSPCSRGPGSPGPTEKVAEAGRASPPPYEPRRTGDDATGSMSEKSDTWSSSVEDEKSPFTKGDAKDATSSSDGSVTSSESGPSGDRDGASRGRTGITAEIQKDLDEVQEGLSSGSGGGGGGFRGIGIPLGSGGIGIGMTSGSLDDVREEISNDFEEITRELAGVVEEVRSECQKAGEMFRSLW